MNPIERAIAAKGGIKELAAALGVSRNVVWNWQSRGKCPATQALAIEAVTNGLIPATLLRPDVFHTPK